jgi:hypothetical protein
MPKLENICPTEYTVKAAEARFEPDICSFTTAPAGRLAVPSPSFWEPDV